MATPAFSSIEVSSVSPAFIWAYYLVLSIAVWLRSQWGKLTIPAPEAAIRIKSGVSASLDFVSRLPRKWIIPPLLLIAILVTFTAATLPDDNLHISFLDVGEGDAIFIQKGHQQVLVDGGPSPQAINLALGSKMPFWDRTIDLLVLTHPHHDHLAGLVEILQRFRVSQVLYPNLDSDSPVYDEWLRLIDDKGIEQTLAQAGQLIDLGEETAIRVLHPQVQLLTETQPDVDNNCIVLRLSQGEVSFLLTGDIMQETEWELIRSRSSLTSTVLKVAHHGSDTSSTAEFLEVVDLRVAVISAGADNKFGHPSDEVLSRLKDRIDPANIYRTDKHGTIEFITDGKKLWVEAER